MKKSTGSAFRTVRGYQLLNQQERELTPALEDYLEMAYRLCQTNGYTRVGKISEILNVKPSCLENGVAFKRTGLFGIRQLR